MPRGRGLARWSSLVVGEGGAILGPGPVTYAGGRMRRLSIAAVALALLAAGCGSSGGRRPNESATLVLDFTPNAVHAGIYLALERDYTGAEGVGLHVREPSSSTDSVKLLAAGRAQFAILDIHDLAI